MTPGIRPYARCQCFVACFGTDLHPFKVPKLKMPRLAYDFRLRPFSCCNLTNSRFLAFHFFPNHRVLTTCMGPRARAGAGDEGREGVQRARPWAHARLAKRVGLRSSLGDSVVLRCGSARPRQRRACGHLHVLLSGWGGDCGLCRCAPPRPSSLLCQLVTLQLDHCGGASPRHPTSGLLDRCDLA